MSSMIERIAESEQQALELKKQAAAQAREKAAEAAAEAARRTESAQEKARDRLAYAEETAKAEGRALFDEIFNENAAKADQRRKEAEKRLNAAAEYIIEKAAQA